MKRFRVNQKSEPKSIRSSIMTTKQGCMYCMCVCVRVTGECVCMRVYVCVLCVCAHVLCVCARVCVVCVCTHKMYVE